MSFAADAGASEELARAELYGLLSRLWLAAPDAELLGQFSVAVTEAPQPGGFLEAPWHDLVAAMRASSVAAATAEYEALFGGVGKPEILLYGSFYLSGVLHERPLALLRQHLASIGLEGDETRGETEDHIACVFEVMRYLIAGDDAAHSNLEQQRRFFRAQVQPWVERCAEAVLAHPGASLWREVAALTQAFMQVETQGFDMLD